MERSEIEPYVRKIKEIDDLLRGPARSLIDIVTGDLENIQQRPDSLVAYTFPACLSESMVLEAAQPLTHAVCCATLQRLWNVRRRFGWLERAFEQSREVARDLEGDELHVREAFAKPMFREKPGQRKALLAILENDDFGQLDVFTASQIFWVLLHAGEKRLHSPVGFLTFFVMVWALNRRFPDPFAAGVSVGGCPPTAWITAKCVGPLSTLAKICSRRARLFEMIGKQVEELRRLGESGGPSDGRKLPFVLEDLVESLTAISSFTIGRDEFKTAAAQIESKLEQPSVDAVADKKRIKQLCAEAMTLLARALRELGRETAKALDPVGRVVGEAEGESDLLGELVATLEGASESGSGSGLRSQLRIELPMAPLSPEAKRKFWKDQHRSAQKAHRLTHKAFEQLRDAGGACRRSKLPLRGPLPARAEALGHALGTLIKANRYISEQVRAELSEPGSWCVGVMTRQVAYASSGNWTEFDPAELVSSLHVGVSQGQIQGDLAVQDAIEKALKGHRGDGSWTPGQPFWSRGGVGVGPPTSEVAWMLAEILAKYPKVTSADEVLSRYVEWLGRTLRRVPRSELTPSNRSREEREENRPAKRKDWMGWVTERDLGDRIDLWATAFAINALLGIRDLMEFRLWEHCEKRFKALPPIDGGLATIDPVDLGIPHPRRLHRRLSRMVRDTDGDRYADAEYSLILHGPPGSSKTAVIQALAGEMWKDARRRSGRGARLIRITPADFTRMGEDRLDSEAALIFEVLGRIRGVTILFDEIDDLLQKRQPRDGLRFMDLVVPAMLNRLQDLRDVCPRQEVAFLLATNYVEKIERALIRKGRIDDSVPVVYPDRKSREWIVARHVEKLRRLARQTGKKGPAGFVADVLEETCRGEWLGKLDGWPWKDIDELFKEASRRLELLYRPGNTNEDAVKELDRLQSRAGSKVPPPPYGDEGRQELAKASPELRREMFFYALSTRGGKGELRAWVSENGKVVPQEEIDVLWEETHPS